MTDLDEAMDEKLDRLERENEQLRRERTKILSDALSVIQSIQLSRNIVRRENEQLHADKQELMDALGPFVTGAWVPLQTLQFAKKVHDKHYESMT